MMKIKPWKQDLKQIDQIKIHLIKFKIKQKIQIFFITETNRIREFQQINLIFKIIMPRAKL